MIAYWQLVGHTVKYSFVKGECSTVKIIYGIEKLVKTNKNKVVVYKLPHYFENMKDCKIIANYLNEKNSGNVYKVFRTTDKNLEELAQIISNDNKLIVSKEKAGQYFGVNNFKIFKDLYDYHKRTQANREIEF